MLRYKILFFLQAHALFPFFGALAKMQAAKTKIPNPLDTLSIRYRATVHKTNAESAVVTDRTYAAALSLTISATAQYSILPPSKVLTGIRLNIA